MTEADVKAFRALAKRVGTDWQTPPDGADEWRARMDFTAAARNNAERLCDMALYALELERIVHDIQRNEAADLIAEAQRRGREEVFALLALAGVWRDLRQSAQDGVFPAAAQRLRARLPPLPAESPTNRDLRERVEKMEAENARLRAAMAEAVKLADYAACQPAIRDVFRKTLEATE